MTYLQGFTRAFSYICIALFIFNILGIISITASQIWLLTLIGIALTIIFGTGSLEV